MHHSDGWRARHALRTRACHRGSIPNATACKCMLALIRELLGQLRGHAHAFAPGHGAQIAVVLLSPGRRPMRSTAHSRSVGSHAARRRFAMSLSTWSPYACTRLRPGYSHELYSVLSWIVVRRTLRSPCRGLIAEGAARCAREACGMCCSWNLSPKPPRSTRR